MIKAYQKDLKMVLNIPGRNQNVCGPTKASVWLTFVQFLVHVIGVGQNRRMLRTLAPLTYWNQPTNISNLRSFIGPWQG